MSFKVIKAFDLLTEIPVPPSGQSYGAALLPVEELSCSTTKQLFWKRELFTSIAKRKFQAHKQLLL